MKCRLRCQKANKEQHRGVPLRIQPVDNDDLQALQQDGANGQLGHSLDTFCNRLICLAWRECCIQDDAGKRTDRKLGQARRYRLQNHALSTYLKEKLSFFI